MALGVPVNSCATCRYAEPAPRYPDDYRHCSLDPYGVGRGWAGVRCAACFQPPRWAPAAAHEVALTAAGKAGDFLMI